MIRDVTVLNSLVVNWFLYCCNHCQFLNVLLDLTLKVGVTFLWPHDQKPLQHSLPWDLLQKCKLMVWTCHGYALETPWIFKGLGGVFGNLGAWFHGKISGSSHWLISINPLLSLYCLHIFFHTCPRCILKDPRWNQSGLSERKKIKK